MDGFVVHTVPGSSFARSVLATLIEKGAAFRVVRVAPGTLKGEAHLALHPFGRVPVFEHGGFRLYETQAIMRYLERVLPDPALVPGDARSAARMDQVLGICDWYLFAGVTSVIGFQRIIKPRLLGGVADEAVIAEAMPRSHVAFAELSRLLGVQPFIAGEALSLADLMLAPQLSFLAMTPEWTALSNGRENLVEWLTRMEGRESMRATTTERVAELCEAVSG